MKNNVQLITYADRLGGSDIKALHRLLKGPLAGLSGGVHILPFYYPIHGADAGFVNRGSDDIELGHWSIIIRLDRK
jgi:sucrose phosphorylase